MYDSGDESIVSRRALLRASAGTAALGAVGSVRADDSGGRGETARRFDGDCPDATIEPGMTHCEGASMDGCTDDHPATVELQSAVADALERRYPDADALIDAGFKPYFDTLETEDDSWSHWLSPTYIGDDAVLDPERPESVLVDNDSWRSIGVMFIATDGGEPVEPPAVYGTDESEELCSPWHAHTGLPGRFAWWYYRQAYERDFEEGDLEFPCRTPCMLHVWTVDHPASVYAHDAPPADARDLPPADDPAFETDGVPGEDELDWDVLPDELVPERTPESIARPFGLDLGR
ncbi:hypothetical protein [Natrinema longum]|uniref:Uncharacterized protein n=1 Tax=Natrinema longum TaxID=370324 RepID=A0A8A2UBJ4_9EURY|nr:hypothetical protein [Natrinema longum]MBZ6496100.1 hypothetical protein [Natrinema longum]QSW85973.1 hypothetical protein J0X27_03820 [Natrinema longum]